MDDALPLTWFMPPFAWASRGTRRAIAWKELVERLESAQLWPGDVPSAQAEAGLSGWSGALFLDDARVILDDEKAGDEVNRGRVQAVCALFVEYEDDPAAAPDTLARWWAGRRFIAYTTAQHQRPWHDRPPGARWRLLLPLSRPVKVEQAVELARWVGHPRHGAGVVAKDTERVWRAVAAPAMNPGGYHGTFGDGEPVDVDLALRELEVWRDQDRLVAAQQVLGEGQMSVAVASFARRMSERAAPTLASAWPGLPHAISDGALSPPSLAGPAGMLGVDAAGPRPGRLSMLVGPPFVGRGALALQIAHNNARAGFPVLIVALRMGTDEGLARLIALRAPGPANADAVLARACTARDLAGALDAIRRELPLLSWWTPGASERDGATIARRVKAAADLAEGRPPLVVIDAIDAWDGPEDALAASLFDVLRPDTLGPGWGGAEVLALDHVDRDADWHDVASFTAALERDRGPLYVPTGPVAREASRILGIVANPAGDPRAAVLGVVRDRLGPGGALHLRFDGPRGRFTPASADAA